MQNTTRGDIVSLKMATSKSGWKSENGKVNVRDGNEDEEKELESDEDDDDGQKFEDFRKKKSSEDNVYSHNVSSHGSVLTEERLIIRRALEANIVRDNDRGDLKKGNTFRFVRTSMILSSSTECAIVINDT